MKITLDWKEYEQTARQAIAEGCVLLENNGVLPLQSNTTVSIFGRIQSSYYKSGTGSGGKVNVDRVYGIVDGLEESGIIKINKELQKIYTDWEKDHPYDEGLGWGKERWSQDEMPLTEQIVSSAAAISDVAIVIIGRTAGEDKDNSATEGSYLLSDEELDMLKKVRAGFKKVVVLLNVGNIIDMSFMDTCKPDAVMYVWQGGMLGGLGAADALTGKIAPSGHLTDTIAYNISDYPTDKYFGNADMNEYSEDIFCGYRYFETFGKDKVRYPFGFGLTYSTFKISNLSSKADNNAKKLEISATVKNTGSNPAKETVQIYVEAPCGKLGKASRVLVDFGKTDVLTASASQTLNFSVPYYNFASYDDSNATENKSCWILEAGDYSVFVGSDVRSAQKILTFPIPELIVLKKCEEALAPHHTFKRMQAVEEGENIILKEGSVPVATIDQFQRRANRLPAEIKQVSSSDIKLADVLNGKAKMEDFIAQLTDDDLSCIIRGEGMGSSLVTPGTASAFGGVSPRLRELGLPVCCCDDGPSGMRLDCGIKAFSLPNGTLLASTFNCDLITKLYAFTGLEMQTNKVENLLGPGMNIHRHPLNGRNFEYFSEDPLVTGKMGTAMLKGLHQSGVTGTIKHFAGNEQEKNRYGTNSVASERALREIYLKGFEIAVTSGYADSVMTTYGILNDLFTASSYDLNTTILRNDWGFSGIVMTDWWANISDHGDKTNFAAMIRAQNDLYMCCPDGSKNATGDNTLSALEDGSLTRGELQRSATNICNHVMNTVAMKRLLGTADQIEIINRPKSEDDVNLDDIEFTVIGKDEVVFDLTYKECKANSNYTLAFDVTNPGTYQISLTASSELGELAQLPCTLSVMGIPIASFVFNGTGGKEVTITKEVCCPQRFLVSRLFVASNGLKLKDFKVKYLNDEIKFF